MLTATPELEDHYTTSIDLYLQNSVHNTATLRTQVPAGIHQEQRAMLAKSARVPEACHKQCRRDTRHRRQRY